MPQEAATSHPMSESEQMYLLTLMLLCEEGGESPTPLAALAQALAIQPVSVNQMVRKLADMALVTYTPYKGVELTATGAAIALRVLRYRRLWEVLLVEKLGMPVDEADTLACRLEHLTGNDVADRLALFLGDPPVSPQGKPIPQRDAHSDTIAWVPLNRIPCATPVKLMRIEADTVTQAFLADEGLRPGSVFAICAAGAEGGLLLEVAGRYVRIAAALAPRMLVTSAGSGAVKHPKAQL